VDDIPVNLIYIMTWSTVTKYLCHKRPWILSVCCNHYPVMS